MPCCFLSSNVNFRIFTPPSAATNEFARQLATAEYGLRGDAAKQSEAIETIEKVLDSLPGYQPEDADWSPGYYADLAVKASLRAGRPGQAKVILIRALQLEPESPQLRYLLRICLRERILQPGDIPRIGKKHAHEN
jgi:hypothetical protein